MKVEILAGSPRQGSVTKRVAIHLWKALRQYKNVEANLIDLQAHSLPFVQTVVGSVEEAPPQLAPLAERIFSADAFILVSPEYNGSYSPALKNLLDHFPKQHRKAFGIVTASPGALGGIRAAQQLQNLVVALFGIGSPHMLIVPEVEKKFAENGQLIDAKFENAVHNFLEEFLWLAQSLSPAKTKPLAIAV